MTAQSANTLVLLPSAVRQGYRQAISRGAGSKCAGISTRLFRFDVDKTKSMKTMNSVWTGNMGASECDSTASELKPAGFWIRVGATLIDAAIIVSAIAMLLATVFRFLRVVYSVELTDAMLLSVLILCPILYHAVALKISGQTLGKKIAGIGVIMMDGSKLSWQRAVVRSCALLVEPFTMLLGCFISVFTPYGRTLHDYIAGTRVVQMRALSTTRRWFVALVGMSLPLIIYFMVEYVMTMPHA